MEITFRRDQAPEHDRVPRAGLRAPLINGPTATFEGVIARVHNIGDPLVYDGGKRLEYRDTAGLRELARQMIGREVVVTHPTRGTGRLAESPEKTRVGRVLNVRVEDGLAIAEIKIVHPEGINAIRNGLRELSAGYGSGTDARGWQRVFEADHLALVREGRCGTACALRTDAACGCHAAKSSCACK